MLPSGATPIGFEGEWLDRFGGLLHDRGRWAERQLLLASPVPPPSDPERLLDRAFDLPNAIWRCRGAAPAWARCVLLLFRYTAVSDDKREGLVWLGFNQSTGAVLDDMLARLLPLLLAERCEWREPDAGVRHSAGNRWDAVGLQARVSPLLENKVRRELEPFLRGMRRRLDRDRARIHEYHQDLRLNALKRLAALVGAANEKAEAERRRETLRVAAIEREYAAKIEDLRHNYALRVTVNWIQCSFRCIATRCSSNAARVRGSSDSTGTRQFARQRRRFASLGWGLIVRASFATSVSTSRMPPAKRPAPPAARLGAVPAIRQSVRAAERQVRSIIEKQGA